MTRTVLSLVCAFVVLVWVEMKTFWKLLYVFFFKMSEKGDDIIDVDMSNMETTFDNLIILKELGNIVNLVR